MTQSVDAVYNGSVLVLNEPLDLEPQTAVRLTIEPIYPLKGFFKASMELQLDGPPDWSERFEEYLDADRAGH